MVNDSVGGMRQKSSKSSRVEEKEQIGINRHGVRLKMHLISLGIFVKHQFQLEIFKSVTDHV